MITILRKVKYGVRNLIKWFPIIWKDRDWDQAFLLEIMRFKMKNMAELHRKYGISVNSEEYAKQLEECSKLAEQLSKEDYDTEDYKEENKLIEDDLDKLFTSMRNNIRAWWD